MKIIFLSLLILLSGTINCSVEYKPDTTKEIFIITPCTILMSYNLLKQHSQVKLTSEQIEELDAENINRFDRIAVQNYSQIASTVSDYMLYTSVLSPLFFTSKNAKIHTLMTFESYLLTYSLTGFSKVTTGRIRPYAYNNAVNMSIKTTKDTQYSFFSGHTAFAFNSAILFANYYADKNKHGYIAYIGGLLNATTIGCLRFYSGKHFPTDILTGAIVGTGSAFLITELHKKNNVKSIETSTTIPVYNFRFEF